MSMIKTPTNQKRFTNVAIVRLNKKVNNKKQKFEIACYPNKVYAWRQNLETDLDQVMQSMNVYTNSSKAEHASNSLLAEYFGDKSVREICQHILEKGDISLTDKERQSQLDMLTKDLVKLIASKTINPNTKTCFSTSVIEKMFKDCHINLKLNKSAKEQSLQIIKILKAKSEIPIEEAVMSAIIKLPSNNQKKQVRNAVLLYCDSIIKEDAEEIQALFEPGRYEEFKNEYESLYSIELNEIVENKALNSSGDGDQLKDIQEEEANIPEVVEENEKKSIPKKGKKNAVKEEEVAKSMSKLKVNDESDEDTPVKGKRSRKNKKKK